MYYIEFVEKNPGVPQDRFQQVVRASSEEWARQHPDDELVLLIGRTWRMGPKPTYMTVWKIRDFARFEVWNSEFQQQDVMEHHAAFEEVATIVDAGVYEDLGREVL